MGKTNLLITGNLNPSVWSLSGLLAEHGFRVTVAAKGLKPEVRLPDQYYAPTTDWSADLPRIYKAGDFHTVIFFYSCASEWAEPRGTEENHYGRFLDMLRQNLSLTELFSTVTRFILITDQRVFGTEQEKSEETVPVPDTYEGRMIRLAEEELERKERKGPRLEKLLVRTTHLYDNRPGTGPVASFSSASGAVRLSGAADSVCDLLSWQDFSAFLLQAVTGDGAGTVHVFQGTPVSYRELSEYFAAAGTGLIPAGLRKDRTLLSGKTAYREFDWVAGDFFLKEAYEGKEEESGKKQGKDRFLRLRRSLGKLAAPAETAAGVLVMELLLRLTETYTTFRIVDVRLLLPVVIGTVHGAVWGLAAALAAWLSYCAAFLSGGGQAWDLLLNMDNWLPLILYLLAGEITGYIRTASRARNTELERELESRTEDLDFLRRLHQSTCDQRDMLAEQVINSRDSYGKVYNMVSALDVLNPDEISFRAVRVLEDVLDCHSVAVYYRLGNGEFLRRIAESPREQPDGSSYSLNLAEFPEMKKALEEEGIFVNRSLHAELPAYAAAQSMGGDLTLVVLLREVEYRQFSRYFRNLFGITVSLISRAMKKAVEFQNDPERYLPGTILLKPEEFISAWLVRRQMRLEHMGSYVLFRLSPALPDTVLSERLKSCIRSLDLAGKMEDGSRFLLLMQSDERYIPMLLKRFESRGIPAEPAKDTDLNIYL